MSEPKWMKGPWHIVPPCQGARRDAMAHPMHELRAAVDRERERRACQRELWWLRAGIAVCIVVNAIAWGIVSRLL